MVFKKILKIFSPNPTLINSKKATPQSRWISGKKILDRWGFSEFEFFVLILQNLQAYPRKGKKITDSDSLEKKAAFYTTNFLHRALTIEDVLTIEHEYKINKQERQVKPALKNSEEITPPSRWIPEKEILDRLVFLEFEAFVSILQDLQAYSYPKKVRKIVGSDSLEKETSQSRWIGGKKILDRWGISEKEFFVFILRELKAYFREMKNIVDSDILEHRAFLYTKNFLVQGFEIEDVLRIEQENKVNPQKQIKPTQPKEQSPQEAKDFNKVDHEQFIRSLKVTYINDTEISIGEEGKRAKKFEKKELGFNKEDAKTWIALLEILKSPDHIYYVGKAYGANKIRNKSYDVAQKNLSEINKRWVSFLSKTYNLQLTNNFKIYELQRDLRPGSYKLKCQIIKKDDTDKEQFKNMTKENLLSEIIKYSNELKRLSTHGDEKSERKIQMIEPKLHSAIEIACNKEWLTVNRARYYINPDEPPEKDSYQNQNLIV